VDISIIIQGVIVGLILAVPVGPLSLICIQRTLSNGKLHGILSGLGVTIADSVYATVAFLGLSAISVVIIGLEVPLRIVAGLVLIAVGVRIIFFLPDNGKESNGDKSYVKDLLSMAALAIANPMTLIFLMVTLPGYGFIFGGTSLSAAAAFVAGFFFGSALWWIVLCSSIGSFRTRISARSLSLINRASGIFIICVGAAMIIGPVLALTGVSGP
jgi:threonine/homoserine/homoserine lactone efflux protein